MIKAFLKPNFAKLFLFSSALAVLLLLYSPPQIGNSWDEVFVEYIDRPSDIEFQTPFGLRDVKTQRAAKVTFWFEFGLLIIAIYLGACTMAALFYRYIVKQR